MLDSVITLGDFVVAFTAGGSVLSAYLALRARLQVFESSVTELVVTVKEHDRLLYRLVGQAEARDRALEDLAHATHHEA